MHNHEYVEWYRETHTTMRETDRAAACGHTVRVHGVCLDCNDSGEDDTQ